MRRLTRFVLGAACAALTATPAVAQDLITGFGSPTAAKPAFGWVFTPTMTYAAGWDDNVLVVGKGDNVRGDMLNVFGPAADLSFTGRRGKFDANYSGGLERYRTLDTLDAYGQHGSVSGRRLMTKHIAVFATQAYASSPTTQLIQLVGVPYVRTGSQVSSTTGGVEGQLTKRLTFSGTYDFEWVKFDAAAYGIALLGGHSHGVIGSIKYQIDDRTAITGDADTQFATVVGPPQAFDVVVAKGGNVLGTGQQFQTQNAWAGLERKLSDTLRVFGAGGISHLAVSAFAPARTGPAWRLGLSKAYRQTYIDATYSRSFVPAFGFGGTLQNEELAAHVRTPITRRTYASGGLVWTRNEPLVTGQLSLRSFWVEGTVGYAVSQWLRVEAFYGGAHQTIDRPGGVLDRNQAGVQIVAAKPMRIR